MAVPTEIRSRNVHDDFLSASMGGFFTLPYISTLSNPQIAGSMIWDDRIKLSFISNGDIWCMFSEGIDATFLRGREIEDVTVNDGEAYVWDGTGEMWRPENVANAGDLQGIPVTQTTPVDCDVLQYVSGTGTWDIVMLSSMLPPYTEAWVDFRLRGNTIRSFIETGAFFIIAFPSTTAIQYDNFSPTLTKSNIFNLAWARGSGSGSGPTYIFIRGKVQASGSDSAGKIVTIGIDFTGITFTVQLAGNGVPIPFQYFTIIDMNWSLVTPIIIRNTYNGSETVPVQIITYTELDVLFQRLG